MAERYPGGVITQSCSLIFKEHQNVHLHNRSRRSN